MVQRDVVRPDQYNQMGTTPDSVGASGQPPLATTLGNYRGKNPAPAGSGSHLLPNGFVILADGSAKYQTSNPDLVGVMQRRIPVRIENDGDGGCDLYVPKKFAERAQRIIEKFEQHNSEEE